MHHVLQLGLSSVLSSKYTVGTVLVPALAVTTHVHAAPERSIMLTVNTGGSSMLTALESGCHMMFQSLKLLAISSQRQQKDSSTHRTVSCSSLGNQGCVHEQGCQHATAEFLFCNDGSHRL
jgi:hypothetical protein